MGDQRDGGIGWTDETWNPIRGCRRVSPGCQHCYAETMAARFSKPGQPYEGLVDEHGRWNGNGEFVESKLLEPLRWQRPRMIFANSMSDLFLDAFSDEQIARVYAVMALASRHTFQLLTKRPQRMALLLNGPAFWPLVQIEADQIMRVHFPRLRLQLGGRGRPSTWPLPNVWHGVTVEDQPRANERIPFLLVTPSAVRFLSCEPLLGPVNLDGTLGGTRWIGGQRGCQGTTRGVHVHDDRCNRGIDWAIVGGESGHGARRMDPAWARSLRDQLAAADVPLYFKQWGEHNEHGKRVGKGAAGKTLDGVEHCEFPRAAT